VPPRLNRFTRETLPTLDRNRFFMNILCIESFFPQKTHNAALRKYTPQARSPFRLPKPASEHVHARLLSDYHEAGLCCYLAIHINNLYVHYRCFTSVSDPFTDSPSYEFHLFLRVLFETLLAYLARYTRYRRRRACRSPCTLSVIVEKTRLIWQMLSIRSSVRFSGSPVCVFRVPTDRQTDRHGETSSYIFAATFLVANISKI
jgi:hypothetical protein